MECSVAQPASLFHGPVQPLFMCSHAINHHGGPRWHHALLLRRVYIEWVDFYPLPKCPLRSAKPWAQELCTHPSILPHPAPPKVGLIVRLKLKLKLGLIVGRRWWRG